MRQTLNIEKMPAKKKFTVVVTLETKPEKPAFNLNMFPSNVDKGFPYKRIFLANNIDYSIKRVMSVTVNGVEIPDEVYVSKTRDPHQTGFVLPRCGFEVRDEVELDDFELVMKYVKV